MQLHPLDRNGRPISNTLHRALRVLLLALPLAAGQAMASDNLLTNPGAEAGPGSDIGEVVAFVPGWTLTSNFTVPTYAGDFGGPVVTSPGPLDRGLNYFAGGPDNPLSSATQVVDLGSYQTWFSTHPLAFTLSGWFGGFSDQNDNAVLSVSFRDAANNEIEFASTGIVDAASRNDVTGLMFLSTGFAASNNVNLSPLSAVVTLTMTRLDGSYNDGYADNLLFTIDDGITGSVPEPTTAAMWLIGLGAMGWRARRHAAQLRD